jgi:hypothetical protein
MLPLSAVTQRVVKIALHLSSSGKLDKIRPGGSNVPGTRGLWRDDLDARSKQSKTTLSATTSGVVHIAHYVDMSNKLDRTRARRA